MQQVPLQPHGAAPDMITMQSDLDRLKRVFDANRSRWLEEGRENQWVAIAPDERVIGFFADYGTAYVAASEELGGDQPFLLQEVVRQEKIEQIQLLSWT